MSEFECRYGHFMRFGEDCKECAKEGRFGERTFYMDGKTSRQLAAEEREYDRREYEPEED